MSADFGAIAAQGVNTIGTLAVVGTVAKVGTNMVNNLNRQGGGYRRRSTMHNPRRSMSHKSVYHRTPRKKSYSIFS